jgi:hypothetical protein
MILLLLATACLVGFVVGRVTAPETDRCAAADTVILPAANGRPMVARLC